MNKDLVFWTTLDVSTELMIQAQLLKKSGFDKHAMIAAATAGLILFPELQDQKPVVPEALGNLIKKFISTKNPLEKLDVLDEIKKYER